MSFVFQSGLQCVSSLNVPYVSPISGGLKAGTAIFIQGEVLSGCDSFAVSLKCGESEDDDIAIAITPQIKSNSIVLNSRQNKSWGKLETLVLPLQKGSSFDLIIAVNSENYQVYWNGSEVGQFQHRIPLERATTLDIGGGVSLTNVFTGSCAGSSIFEHGGTVYSSQDIRNESWSYEGGSSQTTQFGGIKYMTISSSGETTNGTTQMKCSTSSLPTEIKKTVTCLGSVNWGPSTIQTEVLHPVQNPNLPYVGPISGGLKAGMALFLQGVVANDADYFALNFKTGPSDKDDVAFHFNPRIGRQVAMNSLRNEQWESEECVSDIPFKKGEAFNMFVVTKPEGYQVHVNGKEYCFFKHRIPLEKVSTLNILGQIRVPLLGFVEKWSTSSFPTEVKKTVTSLGSVNWGPSTIKTDVLHPVQNPNLPYVGPISGGLKAGMALFLQGVMANDADYFALNFKTGPSDKDDVAFHFNPRIGRQVAMNSLRNGQWESEECVSDIPFKKGEAFNMFVVTKPEGYQVHVNGKEYCFFKHRIPLEKVSTLNILGQIRVPLLGFVEKWSTTLYPTEVKKTVTSLGSVNWGPSTIQTDVLHPVQNPNLPYVGPISGGLKAGMALFLQGVVANDADYFALNFKTGPSDKDDVAFHFNPRIGRQVAMNSLRNGQWESEECVSDIPFKKGEAFNMFVVTKPEGYQVHVNGKEYCFFKHRIPLEKVSTLNILGQIRVPLLGFVEKWSTTLYPTEVKKTVTSLGSVNWGPSTIQTDVLHPVQNPNLPYVGPISGGLKAGMALFLQGVVANDADYFALNFKTGPSDKDDVAFHFNPRIGRQVAMNSLRNGQWESEECVSDIPFKKGEAFNMFVVTKPEGYQVHVNGKEYCFFKHRIPLEKVSTLNILGQIRVPLLGFVEKWSTTLYPTEVKKTVTSLGSVNWGPSTIQTDVLHPVQNPNLPYVGPISGGLKAGMALFLQGVVANDADYFALNFKTGPSDKDDVAFHFNPRIGRQVAMNSLRNGQWESEECVSDIPFKKGEAFNMFVVTKPEGYQVHVNGKEYCFFKHRIPLEKVSTLNILGQIRVPLLGFVEKWSTTLYPTEVKKTVTSLGSVNWGPSTIQTDVLHPVQNPNLPYVGPISGGLKAGMALFLQGVVANDADYFALNFKTGPSDKDDVAFHFNPRIGRQVAMNSLRNGQWESEECVSDIPFKKGEAFNMFVVTKPEGYQVHVNGKEYCFFKHRIPLEKVSTLNILGQIRVPLLGFVEKWSTTLYPTEVKKTVTSLGSVNWGPSTIQTDVLHPVQNPNLPYVGPISGGLKAGMALFLQGVVANDADYFALNLKTGPSDKDDVAFHFNPRIGRQVAMNSLRNGQWESEECVSDIPFKKGEAFNMFVVTKPEGYQVHVNGKEYCFFKHRIPLEKVSTLNILGQIRVPLLGFVEKWSTTLYPTEVKKTVTSLGSVNWGPSTIQTDVLHPVQNPSLPYVGPISGGLKAGMALFLQGVVAKDADEFSLNFKTGQSDKDDVAFHFNPKIGKKVAMNSFRNGQWESEESVSDNPFKKGEAFNMFIVTKPEGYQVHVNGKEHSFFNHRIPLEKVSALNIFGRVSVPLLGFVENWSTTLFPTEVKKAVTSLGSVNWGPSTIQTEVLHPVQNPSLPYVGPISGGLKAGMALFLQGVVAKDADEFSLNFKTGQSDKDDVAFHFNPKIGKKVAMNSFRNGQWESEESVSDNPFKKGEAFNMFIVTKPEGYQVHVNGKEHSFFNHRIPLEKVSALNIFGRVSVPLLGFVEKWSTTLFPTEAKKAVTSLSSVNWGPSTIQTDVLHPVQNPNLPYVGPISGGLKAGMALFLQGVVAKDADQFTLNFKTGQSDKDDVAFHFNPRFGSKVAMNSLRNGQWESEECVSDIPFKKGEAFNMFVVTKPEGYQVHVNGKEYCFFKHRIPLEKVSTLNILGQIRVPLLGFVEKWSTSSFPTEVKKTVTSLGSVNWGPSTIQTDVLHPVQNPSLPYVGPISGGLKAGMALFLQGVVANDADEFSLNFKTGQSDKDDVAFHFNPKIGKKVAMNSFRNGQWESEESVSDNPFKKGEAFNMFIVTKPEGYQVHVNGKEHSFFNHRIPLEKVSALNIFGRVSVPLLGFVEKWSTTLFPTEVKKTVTSLGSVNWGPSTIQTEVLHPVQNPSLPYVGPISGGLKAGMALFLQGVVAKDADEFSLNFKTGQSDKDDVAFHFNPKIGKKVAMNSFRNGQWESEESVSDNPFKKGEAFNMFIVTKPEGYQVHVNGKEHSFFNHRIPLEKVSALNIFGRVSVPLLGFVEKWSTTLFPTEVKKTVTSLGSVNWGPSTIQTEVLHPVQNPSLPYVGPISGGLKAGMALFLQGVVAKDADEFSLNFKTGQSDKDDVAFHFNPKIGSKVAMNSFRNGQWESEESVSDNPFKKGEAFNMFIVTKPEGYQVHVNGKEHSFFNHRIPLEKVSALNIFGRVSVPLLGFVEKWSTTLFPTEVKKAVTSLGSVNWGPSTIQTEVLHPVQNPNLPYVGPISGGLKAGMALFLQGVVAKDADQFTLNFKTGQSNKDDVAFHFNPRFGSKVAMNSSRNGQWESEECVSDIPFKKGEAFNMFVVTKPEGYQVHVNGKEHCFFKHRIPLEKVSTLNIFGQVSVPLLGFVEKWSTSLFPTEVKKTVTSLCSVNWGPSTIQTDVLHPVQNPNLPYVGPISGGLKAGMALFLQGVVAKDADQFTLNFKTGQSNKDDVAFHFNPRFGSKVAMNSSRNGQWESEECVSDIPFKKGEAFNMFVVTKPEGYQVHVNGKEYCFFKHRIPLEKVSTLNIFGQVSVPLLGLVEKWSTTLFPTEVKKTVTSLCSVNWGPSTIQTDVLHPVQNPNLPYVGPITGGLKAGMALFLQGVVAKDADQFTLNFKTGPSDKDDVAFHFNPRFGRKVAMNSLRNGQWESEECVSDIPFKKGEAFNMFVVTKPEGYQVHVNGKEYCFFKHRIPLEKVSGLNIFGQVSVLLLGFVEKWSTSLFPIEVKKTVTSLGSVRWGPSTIQTEVLHPVQNPILPYVGSISGGLRAGMALFLQGVVPHNADQFSVNLKTGQSDNDDIAFHFNPRFGSNVVLNSCKDKRWGNEEFASHKPFTKGEAFDILIVFTFHGYKVHVNGEHHCMFNHRIPLEKVSSVDIRGNVSINLLGFIMDWEQHSSHGKPHCKPHCKVPTMKHKK